MEKESATLDWTRHWRAIVVAMWVAICAFLIFYRWHQINWFALGDTDDNLRLAQVRAWLDGQGWFDLRQYRLNPPLGADIHWSRIVDLPLAGLILLFRPLVGGALAEQIAVAAAPMLPLLVLLLALALTARRLVAPWAAVLAVGIFIFCHSALSMFFPLRIDHHGWQLAALAVIVAGLADPERARGGVTVGLASALSLAIGLEMLVYLAIAGGAIALRWIVDRDEAERLRGYGLALAGGVGLGFLLFASEANRLARCDALTPVWLSVMLVAGALLFALSHLKAEKPHTRLAAAIVAGAVLIAGFAAFWPQCLSRPEQISPELNKLWFSNIREVKPLYTQNIETFVTVGVSALLGLAGGLFGLYRSRGSASFGAWIGLVLLSLVSALMLLWQSRVGPAVQLLSVPGSVALGAALLPKMRASRSVLVRTIGTVAVFALVSGLASQWALMLSSGARGGKPAKPVLVAANRANARCATIPALAPIAKLPAATIFTFVDLSPRLIVLTHHSAITGPYHRNGDAILDVHHAFRGSAPAAHALIAKHAASLVLVCVNSSESTIYKADRPNGFYAQLARGEVPDWLTPVALPKDSPYRLWRVTR